MLRDHERCRRGGLEQVGSCDPATRTPATSRIGSTARSVARSRSRKPAIEAVYVVGDLIHATVQEGEGGDCRLRYRGSCQRCLGVGDRDQGPARTALVAGDGRDGRGLRVQPGVPAAVEVTSACVLRRRVLDNTELAAALREHLGEHPRATSGDMNRDPLGRVVARRFGAVLAGFAAGSGGSRRPRAAAARTADRSRSPWLTARATRVTAPPAPRVRRASARGSVGRSRRRATCRSHGRGRRRAWSRSRRSTRVGRSWSAR